MKLISPFLKIQNQLRIFHWQTTSYAQHKAFGKAYENLDDLIDNFVETFTGKYGRSKASVQYTIDLDNLSDNYLSVVDSFISYLIGINEEIDQVLDSDLLNIRDEMLGELNRLKYLLSLN
jgi:DNA-binding ferritin-like protein